jgi:hypothetical protein
LQGNDKSPDTPQRLERHRKAVAETQSFVRAASGLGLSRSALSDTIRALEERVGIEPASPITINMGRSRGGLTSKLHAVVDAHGLPVHLALTPGEAHDNRLCSFFSARCFNRNRDDRGRRGLYPPAFIEFLGMRGSSNRQTVYFFFTSSRSNARV